MNIDPYFCPQILNELPHLDFAVERLSNRAFETYSDRSSEEAEELRKTVRERSKDLLDEWCTIAQEQKDVGGRLQYQAEVGSAKRLLYEFLNPELNVLHPRHKKFRANRSMRDVEPTVNLWMKTLEGIELAAEEEDL